MSSPLRAITVSVDYGDYLSITLPYNRHHYSEYWVVTTDHDHLTRQVAEQYNCHVFTTDSFYRYGSNTFAKWIALEEGLGMMGRHGWLNILDADVLLPKEIDWSFLKASNKEFLYGPLRNMYDQLIARDGQLYIPQEDDWRKYRIHHNTREWPGYCQIFNCGSSRLKQIPYFEQDWQHCGGADSIFQDRWSTLNKIRTPWNVLHLGQNMCNWFGRTTQMLDGTLLPNIEEKIKLSKSIWKQRIRGGRPSKTAL